MRLARLDVTAADVERLPLMVSDDDRPVVIRVLDADPVTMLAGVGGDWSGSWGVWLEADDGYSAGLIARDVKTLARLMDLDHVVVHAEHGARQYAEGVAALLGDAPVTLHNDVVRLTNAVNRPAPPHDVTVWSAEGDELHHDGRTLARGAARGALTFYDD